MVSSWTRVSIALGIALAVLGSCKGGTTTGSGGAAGSGGGATATTTTSTTTGPDGGDVDAGPIVCLAAYTNIAKNGPCNLIDQDCAAGDTCVPASNNAGVTTACQPSSGLKSENEPCYSQDECDAKLLCIGQTGTHPGACIAFCCNDSNNEPCNGGICNLEVDFGGGYFAYMCSYGQRCQLLTADACPPGYDCHVEPAAGEDVAVCIAPSPTPVPELGACMYINDCGSMQDCFGISNGGVCLYYCDLSGSGTTAAPGLGGCPTGETCQSTYEGQAVDTGVSGVGLCIPNGGIHAAGPDAGAGDAGNAGNGDAGNGDAGHDAGTADGGHDAGAIDDGGGAGGSTADAGADGGGTGGSGGGDAGGSGGGASDAGQG